MFRSIFILLCLSVSIFAQLSPYEQQLLNNLEYQRQMQQQYEQQYQRQQQAQQTQQLMMLYMLTKMAEGNKTTSEDDKEDDEEDDSQHNPGSNIGGVDQEIRLHVDPNDRVTEEEYNRCSNHSNANGRSNGTTCYVCKGEGKKKCTFCGGDGFLPSKRHYTPNYSGSGTSTYTEEKRECGVCSGTGKAPCTACGGNGSK